MSKEVKITENAKILIIQLRRIGDVLLTTPVVRTLREKYPRAQIDFLVEKPSDQILQGNPYLNNILIYDKKQAFRWIREVKKSHYEIIFDFLQNPRTAWIMLFSGAKYKIGFSRPGRDFVYNIKIVPEQRPMYVVDYKMQALKILGIDKPALPSGRYDCRLDLPVPTEAETKASQFLIENGVSSNDILVGFAPTSRRQARIWPKEKFAQLADLLQEKYSYKTIFFWGPNEKESIEKILALMRTKPLVSPPTTIKELAALISKCSLVVGNDNGPLHMAAALNRPSVVIFGPTQSECWLDPGEIHQAVKANVACIGCNKQECASLECMQKVSVEDVEKAIFKMINPVRNKSR